MSQNFTNGRSTLFRITRADLDPDLYRHKVSLHHNALNTTFIHPASAMIEYTSYIDGQHKSLSWTSYGVFCFKKRGKRVHCNKKCSKIVYLVQRNITSLWFRHGNPSAAETGVLWDRRTRVNTMAAVALDPCITRPSTAMILSRFTTNFPLAVSSPSGGVIKFNGLFGAADIGVH